MKFNQAGIVDFYLDGSPVSGLTGIDLYNSSTLYNQDFLSNSVSLGSGKHKIEIKINGKNVSSTNYVARISWVHIIKSDYIASA